MDILNKEWKTEKDNRRQKRKRPKSRLCQRRKFAIIPVPSKIK